MTSTAALRGIYGLQAVINDTSAIFVRDNSPTAETRYRARFYFDPNSISMAAGDVHTIFTGGDNTEYNALAVQFGYIGSSYQIRALARKDGIESLE